MLFVLMNYWAALEQYKQQDDASGFLVKLFERGENDYNRKRLFSLLKKARAVAREQKKPVEERLDQPAEVQKLIGERQKLYRLRDKAFYDMKHAPNQQLRHSSALAVLELQGKIDDIWAKLDFYREYGQLPPTIDVLQEEPNPLQIAKRIGTLRTYITHARKGRRFKKEDIPRFAAEIQQLEKQLT